MEIVVLVLLGVLLVGFLAFGVLMCLNNPWDSPA